MQLLIYGVKTTGPNLHNLLLFYKNKKSECKYTERLTQPSTNDWGNLALFVCL